MEFFCALSKNGKETQVRRAQSSPCRDTLRFIDVKGLDF